MSIAALRRHPFVLWGLLALVQLGLIAVPLADRLEVQSKGKEVTLELVPVDPRDLLRGDYVIIKLAINTLPKGLPGTEVGLKTGETVYVGLAPSDKGVAVPTKVSRTREEAGAIAIKGTVLSGEPEEVRVDYGIDAFFLPEGEGKKIERLPAKRVQLVAAIHPDGRSLPLRLLIDGEEFKSDAAF